VRGKGDRRAQECTAGCGQADPCPAGRRAAAREGGKARRIAPMLAAPRYRTGPVRYRASQRL